MPVLHSGDSMNSRSEYFRDLIADCVQAVDDLDIDEEHQGAIIAALIQSDSYNGMRKAMLQALAAQRGDKS
jgi:metal-responsive CopG/Arc/MetJ family transcriptional regulator